MMGAMVLHAGTRTWGEYKYKADLIGRGQEPERIAEVTEAFEFHCAICCVLLCVFHAVFLFPPFLFSCSSVRYPLCSPSCRLLCRVRRVSSAGDGGLRTLRALRRQGRDDQHVDGRGVAGADPSQAERCSEAKGEGAGDDAAAASLVAPKLNSALSRQLSDQGRALLVGAIGGNLDDGGSDEDDSDDELPG